MSPFSDVARLSRGRALARDRWIVANCPRVVVPHAAPDGALHALLLQTLTAPNAPRIEVFPHDRHRELLAAGAVVTLFKLASE